MASSTGLLLGGRQPTGKLIQTSMTAPWLDQDAVR